jgi:hypothetical protein
MKIRLKREREREKKKKKKLPIRHHMTLEYNSFKKKKNYLFIINTCSISLKNGGDVSKILSYTFIKVF